jgi:hypothetical protein
MSNVYSFSSMILCITTKALNVANRGRFVSIYVHSSFIRAARIPGNQLIR